MNDIRWKQRFDNYSKALRNLNQASQLHAERGLSELEAQGCIQAFEMLYELSWNLIKDYSEHGGLDVGIYPKAVFRHAYKAKIIADGQVWQDMIKARNQTSHTYNEELAQKIFTQIITDFYPAFKQLEDAMSQYAENED